MGIGSLRSQVKQTQRKEKERERRKKEFGQKKVCGWVSENIGERKEMKEQAKKERMKGVKGKERETLEKESERERRR